MKGRRERTTKEWPASLMEAVQERYNIPELPLDDMPSGFEAVLDNVLAELPERKRNILEMRYKQGMTLKEIGEEYKVTAERIRQIKNEALHWVKKPAQWNRLMDAMSSKQ